MEPNHPLRIGILGAARIARKNAVAIRQQESKCVVSAIASRTTDKAKALATDYAKGSDITIYGGPYAYSDLVNSQDVCDAVYIPLPTTLHKEWVCKVLKSGKHVVVEKPVTLCVDDYKEMIDTAKACGKFIMDGTMFPHHHRTREVVDYAAARVGMVDRIETSFSFLGDEDFFTNDIRTKKEGDPLGCLGDLGWYCIRIALLVFAPAKVISAKVVDCKLSDDGVPLEASCIVKFEGDRKLAFHCGFMTAFRQTVEICGSEKQIKMCDYVLPRKSPNEFELHSMTLTEADLITVHEKEVVECAARPVQEVLMWEKFAKLANSVESQGWDAKGDATIDEANTFMEMSLLNQRVVNALLCSIKHDGKAIDISLPSLDRLTDLCSQVGSRLRNHD